MTNVLIPLGKNGKLTAIDLFCGAGGVSQGMIDSSCVEVTHGVNHSQEAIAAHSANHKSTIHLTEDIKDHGKTLPQLPARTNILWASAECTHLSNAKGGESRNGDSRSLASYLDEYVIHTNPDYFIIENVKEFKSWGPLVHKIRDGKPVYDKKGNPVMSVDKSRKGVYFKRWVRRIKELGYNYSEYFLNSADYGAHTSRVRYFGVFYRKGLEMTTPPATHSKTGKKGLQKWNPCKEKIDLDNEGNSIFGRKHNQNIKKHLRRPLVEKTLARIAYGLKKYHLEDFISKSYGGNGDSKDVSSIDEPLHTVRIKDCHAPVKVKKNYIVRKQSGKRNVGDIDNPLHTITTKPYDQVVTSHFLTQHIRGAKNAKDVNEPCPTILTKDEKQLITVDKVNYIVKHQSGKHQSQSIEEPLHTILTRDQKAVITIEFNDDIQKEAHEEKVEFFKKFFPEHDPHIMSLIISDIKMRYLTSIELADITGFHPDSELGPNETLRKKHIGNAVPPVIPKAIMSTIWQINNCNQAKNTS